MECCSAEGFVGHELARDTAAVGRLPTHPGPQHWGPALAGAQGAYGHVLGAPLIQEALEHRCTNCDILCALKMLLPLCAWAPPQDQVFRKFRA